MSIILPSRQILTPELSTPWRKPAGPVVVDRGKVDPFLAGFTPLTAFGQGNVLQHNPKSDVFTLTRSGIGWDGGGTQSLSAPILPLVGYPVILQVGFKWLAPGPSSAVNILSVSNDTAYEKNRISLFYANSGVARFAMAAASQTDFYDYSLTVGDYYVVEAYFASQNTWKLRVNKSLSGNLLTALGPYPPGNPDTMSVLGQWYKGTYYQYAGSGIEWFCVYDFYDSGLLESEMFDRCDRFSVDPYAMLKPVGPDFYIISTAAPATGETVNLSAGSLALSGQSLSAVATEHNNIAVGAGTLTLTGQSLSAVTTAGDIVEIAAGSLAVTGQTLSAVTTEGDVVELAAGSLAVAGQALSAVTTEADVVELAAGSLAVTGQSLSAVVTAGETSQVPAGSLAVSGQSLSSVTTEHHLSDLAAGTLTISGQSLTVIATAVNVSEVSAGNLSLTGQSISVVTASGEIVQIASGSLTITGQSLSAITTDHNITSLDAALLALSGGTITVEAFSCEQVVDPESSAVTIIITSPESGAVTVTISDPESDPISLC